jgi:hypothetical protein
MDLLGRILGRGERLEGKKYQHWEQGGQAPDGAEGGTPRSRRSVHADIPLFAFNSGFIDWNSCRRGWRRAFSHFSSAFGGRPVQRGPAQGLFSGRIAYSRLQGHHFRAPRPALASSVVEPPQRPGPSRVFTCLMLAIAALLTRMKIRLALRAKH